MAEAHGSPYHTRRLPRSIPKGAGSCAGDDVGVAQAEARVEGLTLLTSDAVVASYPAPVRKV